VEHRRYTVKRQVVESEEVIFEFRRLRLAATGYVRWGPAFLIHALT